MTNLNDKNRKNDSNVSYYLLLLIVAIVGSEEM